VDSSSGTEARVRVLVVEDERIVAADLQRMLRQLGYDAYGCAPTADRAFALAAQTPPDVVLADIRIEGPIDGVDTAFRLRQEHAAAVVFLTAHADDPTVERAKHVEPAGYLIKPITAPAVKAAIEIALDRRRRESESKAFQHALTQTTADFLCALDHLPFALQFEDASGRVLHLNPTFLALFALSQARIELLGRDGSALLNHVQSRCMDGDHLSRLVEALRRADQPSTGDILSLRDGRKIELEYVPLHNAGQRQGQLWLFRDISTSEQEREALQESAARHRQEVLLDPVTGLTSRRGFFELCPTYLKLVRCAADQRRVLFFFDLDGLKKINDCHGHAAGDQAICAVAAALRATFRTSDLLARLGGDEFVALATMTPAQIERVRAEMASRLQERGSGKALGVSIGVAEYVKGESLDALIGRADEAMYREKRIK
jgi:diguanylate cyclase (GGDEF)-like protein